jgi:hypothetical protein
MMMRERLGTSLGDVEPTAREGGGERTRGACAADSARRWWRPIGLVSLLALAAILALPGIAGA